ncbi:hypothetical protein Q428_14715 [Fervidicella metallireducens AeB]|uniref:Uncharacterized protein n=1 Tax=Fervidicella metallireducens AeB TaxID=1403537 RepID=A0A017RRB7_9CLOT|nr:hypothetical protein [Fervidicella metallireducens]EYE87187.1 hypothetical protein Q428_14715 [Fervidicella metallireducens AeB]
MSRKNENEYIKIINEYLVSINRDKVLSVQEFISKQKKEELLDDCVDYISNQFCTLGLDDNSEPNQYGLILEEIIDFLNEQNEQ